MPPEDCIRALQFLSKAAAVNDEVRRNLTGGKCQMLIGGSNEHIVRLSHASMSVGNTERKRLAEYLAVLIRFNFPNRSDSCCRFARSVQR